MHNATRPDGSQFLVNPKPTYFSVGWAPPEEREPLIALLRRFVAAVVSEATPDALAKAMPEPVRADALAAQRLIAQFEATAPERSQPELDIQVWTPKHPEKCNVGIFRQVSSHGEERCDLADQVARALAQMLHAAGARDVTWGTMD